MRKPRFDVSAVRLLIGLLLAWRTVVATAEDWPEFRGPTGQGLSSTTSLPVKWDLKANVRWKVPIRGKGWSSPIVHDGRIFLTTAVPSEEEPPKRQSLRALCLDAAKGETLWDVEVFVITNNLKEPTLASFAVVDKAIIVRTAGHLYRVE